MLCHVLAWISLKFSRDVIEGMHFWQENHRTAVVSFLMHNVKSQHCSCILYLDYLVEVCWSSFSTMKLLFVLVNLSLRGGI